jgi:glycosyltransferase involved in cell wall biosynthesis
MLSTLTCKASEVIVVDNCPDDSTSKDVVKQFKDYIYILEPRVGLDFARNTGIIHVNSPVLAFLDDDVVVHPLWIYNIWQTFNDSSIAAMTGLIIATELKTEAQVIFEKHWSFNRGYINKIYDDNYFKSTFSIGPPVWKIGAGANMAFRTKVFDKVGLFDEILGPGAAGCNDDSEMWFRILANGFKIHYNPRAIVFHEHRSTIKELKSQIYYYMRGFVTAALLQQRQHQKIGYKKHIFLVKPIYYLKLIRRGFPNYDNRYSTLTVELKGMISGLFYYYRNKKRSSNTVEFVDV